MTTLTYRGLPCCSCQAEWFPAFEEELREQGIITGVLTLAQLIGDAEDSAKVHTGGGCADWWETDIRISQVARSMGAPATWPRTGARDSFDDNRHTHSGLRGCPHMAPGALAQIREVDRGGDGLLGDVPDHPDLRNFVNRRSWKQGIQWHREQQVRRRRIAKLKAARARRAKWRRWSRRATDNINRLKSLI